MGSGRRVLVVVAVAAVVRTVRQAGALPARMAAHFDAAGNPNGWMTRDDFLRFELCLVAGLAALFLALPAIVRRLPPRFVNWPNAAYWLAPERRAAALGRMADHLAWLGVTTVAFIAYVNELVVAANQNGGRLDPESLAIGLGAYLVAMGVWVVGIHRGFRVPADAPPVSRGGSRA